jgi:pentatricopeptide repeat protein
MKAYVQSRDIEKATKLIEKMEESEKFAPVLVTYNTYLNCAFKSNNYPLA